MGGATPLIGVSAAAAASSLTLSWEVTVVAPTAAARRAAGFHLARHSAVAMGKDHRVLFDIAMPNFRMATPSFQWADVSATSCSVPLYEVVVGVGFALHSTQPFLMELWGTHRFELGILQAVLRMLDDTLFPWQQVSSVSHLWKLQTDHEPAHGAVTRVVAGVADLAETIPSTHLLEEHFPDRLLVGDTLTGDDLVLPSGALGGFAVLESFCTDRYSLGKWKPSGFMSGFFSALVDCTRTEMQVDALHSVVQLRRRSLRSSVVV